MSDTKLTLEESLKPLVQGWLGKIELARKAKEPFTTVADQCMGFFAGVTGFMWESKFQSKFMNGAGLTPRFKITIAKAFELVAVFGPSLYWQNPQREVKPRKPLDVGPELFGNAQDPMVQQQHQAAQQEMQQDQSIKAMLAQLLENYLNITPALQPHGGLAANSEQAITEALVKGRGCLWPRPYQLPGSDKVLTGCFYDSVDHLLIDPDCRDASLSDAKWIAQECVHPYWEVEREYGYKPDELKKYAVSESAQNQGESKGMEDRAYNRQQGETRDLIRYYKIWSKAGMGARMVDMQDGLKDEFQKTVGDYAYIVIAPHIPHPINAPKGFLTKAYPEQVQERFGWPIPFWKDNKWPVTLLDFYRKPGSAWPIAPLQPGLGELAFINAAFSFAMNRTWNSSRDFICVKRSGSKDVKPAFTSGEDQQVIELSDAHGPVSDLVQVLQMPPMNKDMWQAIEMAIHMFELRTGLSEFAIQGTTQGAQSRSAADVHAKQQQSGVRPEYMAGKVEDWQDEAARMEQYCAGMFVKDMDVEPHFGRLGAFAWRRLIQDLDDEQVLLGMEVTVAAGSAKKPNKARDTENMQALTQNLLPLLAQYAAASRDTKPFNGFLKLMSDAMDQDLSAMQLGEQWPPEDQGQQHEAEMAQQEMQMQQEGHQQELAQGQQELQIKQQEAEMKMQLEAMKLQAQERKMELDAQAQQQDLQFKQAQGQMDMQVKAQTAQQDMELSRVQGEQQIRQTEAQGKLQLQQAKAQGQQQLQQSKQQGDAKAQALKKQSAAKPKPKAGGK